MRWCLRPAKCSGQGGLCTSLWMGHPWKVEAGPLQSAPLPQDQLLTLSFSAFAITTLTALSAGFVRDSPVAGLRT